MAGMLLIGTSGWTYGHWRGRFYPKDLPSGQYLEFYSRHFSTTELNYSFYHVPKPETYRKWAALVPPSFIFAVKANRFITHLKGLQGIDEEWNGFVRNARQLGGKLGPLLVQLPPSFACDTERLRGFLESSRPLAVRLVFEFRHDSWFVDRVYRLLNEHRAALCIADSARRRRRNVVTTDFVYLRYHGRAAHGLAPCYQDSELAEEADQIHHYIKEGQDVYAYFNNDAQAYAAQNASTLRRLCQKLGIDGARALGVEDA